MPWWWLFLLLLLLFFLLLLVWLWRTGGLARLTGSGPGPAPPYTPECSVTPILDGVEFFRQLETRLKAVAQAPGAGHQYAHMRFWWCRHDTRLATETFEAAVKEISDAGHEVRLLLWKPSDTECKADDLLQLRRDNERTMTVLNAYPHVEVRMLEHGSTFGSYHQKTGIFRTGDGVSAMTGGFNIADEYKDKPPHPGAKNWHDVGMVLVGDATSDMEEDFKSDWAKAGGGAVEPWVRTVPAPGSDKVFVASNSLKAESIHRELARVFKLAKSLIYLENYSIHDPELVAAMAERLSATRLTGSPVSVILVLPGRDYDSLSNPIYGWLHYVTYCELSFASCSAFTYDDGGVVKKVVRAAGAKWKFTRDGKWYQDSELEWDAGDCKITAVRSFTGDTPLFKGVHARAANAVDGIYVHSKAGFVDSAFGFIGSANFCPRSMKMDGELTNFFTDDAAARLRDALWKEWCSGTAPPDGPAFVAKAKTNASALSGGTLVAGSQLILPIDPKEFAKSPPDLTDTVVKQWIKTKMPAGSMLGPLGSGIGSLASLFLPIDEASLW